MWLAAGAAVIGRQARDAEGLDLEEAAVADQADPTAASSAATQPPRRRPGRLAEGPPVSVGRWVVVGLWLLAALAVWAWAVASGGARQTAVVDDLGLSRAEIPKLDRGLAVGRYFETSGPSLLAVLDELGQKTGAGGGGNGGGWMVDEVQWKRDTGVTLRGTLRSADALAELARTMATMRTLTGVQVRRQEPADNDKVTYTVVASPSATWYGNFVEPRVAKEKAEKTDTSGDEAAATTKDEVTKTRDTTSAPKTTDAESESKTKGRHARRPGDAP